MLHSFVDLKTICTDEGKVLMERDSTSASQETTGSLRLPKVRLLKMSNTAKSKLVIISRCEIPLSTMLTVCVFCI